MLHKSTFLSALERFKIFYLAMTSYVAFMGIPYFSEVSIPAKNIFVFIYFCIGLICCLVWSMHKSNAKSWVVVLFILAALILEYSAFEFLAFGEKALWLKCIIVFIFIFVTAVLVEIPNHGLHVKLAFEYFSFVLLFLFFIISFDIFLKKNMPDFMFADLIQYDMYFEMLSKNLLSVFDWARVKLFG